MIRILDDYPEFVMQNRKDLLVRKEKLMKKHSPHRTDTYWRNLVKRHPDLIMRSFASFEAKVNYITRNLNKQLHRERCFPMMLHLSYTGHIWPRCELLKTNGIKNFNLEDALTGNDLEFCQRFGFDVNQLKAKRRERKQIEEKDKLWAYVPGI